MKKTKLWELAATAISGNDISSSVLYVAALAIIFAWPYAWITLLIVAVVLYAFRKIYGEVVGALPLNGWVYNALLNTTSKSLASLAATLTVLSYMATAVISGNEAMHYLQTLIPSLPVILATIVLLSLFAILTLFGIKESAKVAIVIFLFHLSIMFVLATVSIAYLATHWWDTFLQNWQFKPSQSSLWLAIFFGFAASMLGISGFESSANFVEEQKKWVFPKTLRNMWLVVSILNPLMAFLALALIPIPAVEHHRSTLLSYMGQISAGDWLATLVSIDAVLVLSGAVLTSYIGVSGLLERLTLDRVLPQFLLKKNRYWANTWIILGFLLLNISILLISKWEVKTLAGVYTISFLAVMGLFAISNILLKVKRASLPRPEKAGPISLAIALIWVTLALIGQILIKPSDPGQPPNIVIFLYYFIPALTLVMIMLNRVALLRFLLTTAQATFGYIRNIFFKINDYITSAIENIKKQEFVYFTKGDDIATLNKVILYILNNEHTKKVKIVSVVKPGEKVPESFKRDLKVLDKMYPELEIEFVEIPGEFGPKLIKQLSKQWNIPINFMFIGSPGNKFPYKIEELGWVRLII